MARVITNARKDDAFSTPRDAQSRSHNRLRLSATDPVSPSAELVRRGQRRQPVLGGVFGDEPPHGTSRRSIPMVRRVRPEGEAMPAITDKTPLKEAYNKACG